MAALGRVVARARNVQWNVVGAAKAWERTSSNVMTEPGFRGGFSTKPRGLFDGIFQTSRPGARPEYGVDTREPENSHDWEDEARPSSSPGKDGQLVAVPEVDDRRPTKDVSKVTETALDKGANVATSALDNMGSILSKTGLEVQLDVSLQELTIDKLVLKELGLVLVIKTKPQPQPGPPPPPEPQPGPPDPPQ